MRRRYKVIALSVITIVGIVVTWNAVIRMYPLRFHDRHAHCIKQTGLGLRMFSGDHGGQFPKDVNGYGDALLLLAPYIGSNSLELLTGPGYDTRVFDEARSNKHDVAEQECGRVYVQGLSESNAPDIVILFDKLATHGADHGPPWGQLGREVLFLNGHMEFVAESDWTSIVTAR